MITLAIALSPGLSMAGWIAFWGAAFAGAVGAFYFAISLPLRRQERARFFLDFLALAVRRGVAPEQAIAAAARSRDPELGTRFHLLAAWLEQGYNLSEALERTPGLLPPSIQAFMRVGERIGNLERVLAECRSLENQGTPQFLKVQNYLAMLPLSLSAVGLLWIVPSLLVFVAPRFQEMFKDFEITLPTLLPELVAHTRVFTTSAVGVGVAILLFAAPVVFYVGGPRFARWLGAGLPRIFEVLLLAVPWYRYRCEKAFVAALTALLDAGVEEKEALRLAADCTGNPAYARRAAWAAQRLAEGEGLRGALRRVSRAPEFAWRLDNAMASPGSFEAALRGWRDALETKAFQLEQAFAQSVTTALVLLNGALVGVLAVAFFQVLGALTQEALLW